MGNFYSKIITDAFEQLMKVIQLGLKLTIEQFVIINEHFISDSNLILWTLKERQVNQILMLPCVCCENGAVAYVLVAMKNSWRIAAGV